MPRAVTAKLIHSVETEEKLSRHNKMIRRRIEESILQTAANDDLEIDKEELKRQVFLEESSKKTYVVSKTEVDIITGYVWDKGLKGGSQKRLIEQLYEECELPTTAIARRDKIDTKVHNIYRTFRETKQMFEDQDQPVEDLARRIYTLLCSFKDRDGGPEALAAYGIIVDDSEEE